MSDDICVKCSGVMGHSRCPMRSSKVPKDGFVKINHGQVHGVDGRQPTKNTGKLNPKYVQRQLMA